MQPPVKGVPVEINRRLDELSRKTRRETIIKTIREIPVSGSVSYPTVSVKANTDLGEWIATDTTLELTALPAGEYMYEFAIRKIGLETWETRLSKENSIIFSGLRPDSQYDCRVRTIELSGETSLWSPIITVVTNKDTTAPSVPTGLSLVSDFYYIRAKVDEITLQDCPDFAGFEFHASIVTGFTPSDSTFKDACRTTRTVFHVSDVGITWYVKVRSFDTNGNYSDYCSQVSVAVPVPRIPPQDTDPTETGDIVIVEGTEELDDCDDHTKWTAEVGGIQLATDTEAFKEGIGALKISIDKYAPVAENLWYNYNPEIPGTFIIGGLASKYVIQGFKVDANCDLKREAIIAWIGSGTPPGLKVMLYDDDGNGNPDSLLGTATFAGVNADEYWRFAEYAAAISITADTQYHKVYCRSDEGVGDYYEARVGINNYSDGIFQYGNALNALTKDETKDIIFRCFDDTATLNQHFKVTTLGAKDISTHENLELWIKSDKTVASWLQASMGEAALGEQTDNITPGTSWGAEAWDISGIAAASRNAIAHFGFKVLDSDPLADPPRADDGKVWVWVDYIRATKEKAVKVKFTDSVATLWPQFAVNAIDFGLSTTGTAAANSTAFQAVIAYAKAKFRRIYVPGGTYDYNGFTIDSSYIDIFGDGKDNTILNYTGSGKAITIDHASNTLWRCTISDLKIIDGGTGTHGIYSGTNVVDTSVERCHITGFTYGIYFDGNGAYGYLVSDCELLSNGWAVYKTGTGGHNVIEKSVIESNTTGALYLEDQAFIHDNRFQEHTGVAKVIYMKRSGGAYIYSTSIHDNWFEGNEGIEIYLEYCYRTSIRDNKFVSTGITTNIGGDQVHHSIIEGNEIAHGTNGISFTNDNYNHIGPNDITSTNKISLHNNYIYIDPSTLTIKMAGFNFDNLRIAGTLQDFKVDANHYMLLNAQGGNTGLYWTTTPELKFYVGSANVMKLTTTEVQFGTYAALDGEALAGYVTIKDINGNTRKIAVVE